MRGWKITILLFILTLSLGLKGQRILVFDLKNKTIDTLKGVNFDPSITQEFTNHSFGSLNKNAANLKVDIPQENVYPEGHFIKRKKAASDYNVNEYPLRTSLKLYSWANNTLSSTCSGSMISRRHMLTATHCVALLEKDILKHDSFFISPAFDNGSMNSEYKSSWASKVYFFQNWTLENDFTIIELEDPIGDETGWLGIGFNSNDEELLNGNFYKFSYPQVNNIKHLDDTPYNGDTLYYYYGKANYTSKNSIMVRNAVAIPGESGSSLIKVENNEKYVSFGVLTYAVHLNHSRIKNWNYYNLKNIIKNDIDDPIGNHSQFKRTEYNRPLISNIDLDNNPTQVMRSILIYDKYGNLVLNQFVNNTMLNLDLSHLPKGTYTAIIEYTNNKILRSSIDL